MKEVTFCQEMEATVARSCQVPNEVVMIKPDHFGYDPETAQTNAFQPQQQNDTVAKVLNLSKNVKQIDCDFWFPIIESGGKIGQVRV